ncbi:invasion associated locus B family protein [Amaricoccus macauensis]|uniref:invasion associated locus B family protein n=1 Tax=Amaricoccus macauensis TaxID=57001 RepID=UPI003C7BE652
MMQKPWIPTALLIAFASAGTAMAQGPEHVASHTDWNVFVAENPKECYIASQPSNSDARRNGQSVEVRRGAIQLYVSYRPSDSVSNEVSFTGGYPFDPSKPVKLRVGSTEYNMTPGTGEAGEWAWTDASDDANAVEAMRGGATAVLTGVSTRGTTTIDEFSLMGFTAAISDAQSRCN